MLSTISIQTRRASPTLWFAAVQSSPAFAMTEEAAIIVPAFGFLHENHRVYVRDTFIAHILYSTRDPMR